MSLVLDGTAGIDFPDASNQSSALQAASAWARINMTGAAVINDSFNISSITDNGVGDFDYTFATAMANNNYSIVGMVLDNGNVNMGTLVDITTADFRTYTRNLSSTPTDYAVQSVVVFSS